MKLLPIAALAAGLCLLTPSQTWACACGCGVFDVGGEAMTPMRPGGEMFVEYDYQDQNRNWSGGAKAPAADNADKEIRSQFITFGGHYAFNQDWSLAISLPVWSRAFHTENDAGTGVNAFNHTALGDIRITATYTGLFKDRSTGLIAGVKLATGDWKYANFDRDTEIGTGSTDIQLGAYHMGTINLSAGLGYFVRVLWDLPISTQGDYRPGAEVDAAAGVSYVAGSFVDGRIQVTPMLQTIVSSRDRDGGPAANPTGSGYDRVLISPGVQFTSGDWSLYADVAFPVYERVNGDQLVAPELVKVVVRRHF